jgi:hypothetical protein
MVIEVKNNSDIEIEFDIETLFLIHILTKNIVI